MSSRFLFMALGFVSLALAGCGDRQVSYSRDVDPILQANCAVCHTPGGTAFATTGFSVASYTDVMKGTSNGAVIKPGSAVGSTLVRLIRHQADSTINMPKNYTVQITEHAQIVLPGVNARQLPKRDVELIARWVDQGARNN
ncbi:MAG: c-type cytochrome domain-containing protein [Rhodanobacteraceae bacterium]